jgi:hypothetical protein
VYRVFTGKPDGKRALGRPGYRGEDNIKMNISGVGSGVMD